MEIDCFYIKTVKYYKPCKLILNDPHLYTQDTNKTYRDNYYQNYLMLFFIFFDMVPLLIL